MTQDAKNILSVVHHKDKLFMVLDYPSNFGNRLHEDNPLGGVIFYKSKFLVSCARTCQDPVDHTGNSTVTTCADGTTEHTEDEGLGVNICCSSASALCQTGNNDGKSWNFPSYLYQREIQPVVPVSLECSGSRSSKKTAGNKTEREMEYWSKIPRVMMMMTLHLGTRG
ncbi:hypothetical protein pdam_00002509 [Pocillopora damicornis]|uniref:Uncharacterized protein n=1 Tax=Pocillopora damicornis TaxID=46731 RepID=A0A3M6TRQ9_POCDA|nr:hypothetical protein pdam_00002509 [Pocillopora damicornis]